MRETKRFSSKISASVSVSDSKTKSIKQVIDYYPHHPKDTHRTSKRFSHRSEGAHPYYVELAGDRCQMTDDRIGSRWSMVDGRNNYFFCHQSSVTGHHLQRRFK